MFDESGKEISSSVNEVLEISNQTLDAGLFEVPADYREVKSRTELYASLASGASQSSHSGYSNGNSSKENSGIASSVKNMASKSSGNAAEFGAKKEGVVRVGFANVKTGSIGDGINAQELAGAVQNTLSEYLKSPQIEVVALEAKLPSAIDAEAKSKECDFVIYATVSHKKGGGGMFGKTLGNVVGSAISEVGYSSSTAGAIAGHTAANAAGNVKAKDEITLDVKLTKDGAQAFAKQYKQKAKGNGDDIITPIIEQAAQAILDAASKK